MFNEANKKQVLELQNDCYSERIGKVYGDFKVEDVWYDWDIHKQIWKLVCQKCGRAKITHNGKDYSKGKNKGICGCEAKKAKMEKVQEILERKKEHPSAQKWIGQTVGGWKILSWDKRTSRWFVECIKCGKQIYHFPKELQREKPVRCTCQVIRGNYKSHEWLGKRYGHLVIQKYNQKDCKFECRCDCGNAVELKPTYLIDGLQTTCGLDCKYHGEKTRTHGLSKDRIYRIWRGMKSRCYNPKNIAYKTYGGRGIDICDEWRDDVFAFREWALSHGYSDDLSIDRIDNDRGYSPDNCRWATPEIQANNQHPRYTFTKRPDGKAKYKRKVEWTIDGETKSAIEWCEQYGLSVPMVRYRVKKKGMSPKEALSAPKKQGSHDGIKV